MAERWERSTFGGTHRRLNDSHQHGRSQRELQDQASFDMAPAGGCLLIMASTIIAAVTGVILGG
jgi:hypothetical protein